jgi:hypothetical protein
MLQVQPGRAPGNRQKFSPDDVDYSGRIGSVHGQIDILITLKSVGTPAGFITIYYITKSY